MGEVPNDPTIYIYISSKYNPTDAVENGENWFVMINMPPGKEKSELDIESVKEKIIEKVKKTLNIDLNKKIIFEKILTPSNDRRKNIISFGSLYGISSNNRFAAF
ncbi:MAG: hypothetical protein IPG53_09840 [Ignavibacteriales bacterium]|nr:hypothetical protein [Ignavibacteriales bacterium]